MWENDTLRNDTPDIIIPCLFGPDEMNDTCRKMMQTRTMDRGFTAFTHFSNPFLCTLSINKNLENIRSSKHNMGYV